MNFSLVFDPLFRVPFFNGLLLALTIPLLGAYVRLREEWLAALGLAQITAAGGVAAVLVGIHPLAGALGSAVIAALVKGKAERAGNDVYAVMILLGSTTALLGAANSVKGEELSHMLLEGQLYFTSWANLGAALIFGALVAVALPRVSGKLLLERFFPEHLAMNRLPAWRVHTVFDILVAVGVAMTTESIGVMATFGLVFFPPWIAFRLARGWKKALGLLVLISVTSYVIAFSIAIAFNQPFAPVLVGVLIILSFLRLLGGQAERA